MAAPLRYRRNYGCRNLVTHSRPFRGRGPSAEELDTDLIIRIERCTGTPKEELGSSVRNGALPCRAARTIQVRAEPAALRQARILVCGEFFGTGSSREVAVWALASMGSAAA
jgi:3-isopropylmalate/(R)-2-methylmalate dehydratase small subunit